MAALRGMICPWLSASRFTRWTIWFPTVIRLALNTRTLPWMRPVLVRSFVLSGRGRMVSAPCRLKCRVSLLVFIFMVRSRSRLPRWYRLMCLNLLRRTSCLRGRICRFFISLSRLRGFLVTWVGLLPPLFTRRKRLKSLVIRRSLLGRGGLRGSVLRLRRGVTSCRNWLPRSRKGRRTDIEIRCSPCVSPWK